MSFDSKEVFDKFIKSLINLGSGSQGVVYYDSKNQKTYKIFLQYFDNDLDYYVKYKIDEVLRFKDFVNDTIIFPQDVITVCGEVVGYVMRYVAGFPLYTIDPLKLDLDLFGKGIEKTEFDFRFISNHGIKSYDISYNVMYNNGVFNVVDTDDYSFSSLDAYLLTNINNGNLCYEITRFLVDGYFDGFVLNNKILKEMYIGNEATALEFLQAFRYYLSECMGKDIKRLSAANGCLNRKKTVICYERSIKR